MDNYEILKTIFKFEITKKSTLMRVVLTRVKKASVEIDGKIHGQINHGLLALCGYEDADQVQDLEWILNKIQKMRIFDDENGKINLSAADLNLGILLISQFTLFADTRRGNRPSFIGAAKPAYARSLFLQTKEIAKKIFPIVENGIFAADMKVHSINDGPVTIFLDSALKFPRENGG